MPSLIALLFSAAFLIWAAVPVMANHGSLSDPCMEICMDCGASDPAKQDHDSICGACPVIGSILPDSLGLPVSVEHRAVPALPGRLLVAEPTLVSDPPPPRG
ncbi:hypothetical protein [Antarctobacter heliothermus]|uniref:Uncharacterized protein n=1 Tax=Antarctobacter heliothermus TaxID=74033 RepID=A0A239F444_9RHOB|nr:hypothetical protein [Antarctobacter heliothermus]SNS51659.1 hypothetical protein SAMN04488078_101844 [Antarctobacter heliothermus]